MKDDKMLMEIAFVNNTSKLDQIQHENLNFVADIFISCVIVCFEDVLYKLGLGAYPEELLFMIGEVVHNSQYVYFYYVFVIYMYLILYCCRWTP